MEVEIGVRWTKNSKIITFPFSFPRPALKTGNTKFTSARNKGRPNTPLGFIMELREAVDQTFG